MTRQEAIKEIELIKARIEWEYPLEYQIALDMAIEALEKRGEWIGVDCYDAFGGDEAIWAAHGNPIAFHYCSNCKEQAYAGEDGESLLTKYCPNCGARMESDGE